MATLCGRANLALEFFRVGQLAQKSGTLEAIELAAIEPMLIEHRSSIRR